MALPKQVQAQIEEANRIAADMAKSGDAEKPDEQPKSEEVAAGETSESGDLSFGGGAKVVEEAKAPTEGDETSSSGDEGARADDAEDYRHKYSTLQGMYNSEKRANTELTARVQSLETMLAKLQEMRDAPKPEGATPTEPEPPRASLTAEEVDEYGSDLIDVMKRAAMDAVKDEIADLRTENQRLKSVIGGVGQRQEASEKDKLFASLDVKIDNWREVNRDPAFLAWLGEMDVYAGETRRDLLTRAFEANDAARVARFFTGYLEETAAVTQSTSREPAPKPNGKDKVKLDSMVSPGVGHSGTADSKADQGRVWKESEIGAFYESARRGQFKHRPEEYAKVEAQIQSAMNDGRIAVGQ